MTLENAQEIINEQKICDVWFLSLDAIFFLCGEPRFQMYKRDRNDEFDFQRFGKYAKRDQDYFFTNKRTDYSVQLLGYWELRDNKIIILDNKNNLDEEYIEDLFKFIFVGHSVTDIQTSDKNEIKIFFSNGLSINMKKKDSKDSALIVKCNKEDFCLSIEEGVVEEERILSKVGNGKIYAYW